MAMMYFAFVVCALRPVVISTGLFNAIPKLAYSKVFEKTNRSLVQCAGVLTKSKFEAICDEYEADKLPLVVHSSFDPSVLTSHRLERSLLIDPSTLPVLTIGHTSLIQPLQVKSRAPVNVIETKMYYEFVKEKFRPIIENAERRILSSGGHSDVLNKMWANMGSVMGIPNDDMYDETSDALTNAICEWLSNGDQNMYLPETM